jgi:hypothetical protein
MPESERTRAAHLQLLAVSWNFGWPIAAGVALGYWIDQHVGSSPAATLFLGIGAMAASTWRLLQLSKQEQAARHADELARPPVTAPDVAAGAATKTRRWDSETGKWVDDDDSDWPRDEGSGWAADEDSDGKPR